MSLSPDEILGRAEALEKLLSPCRLCPRDCGVNRPAGEVGYCGAGEEAMVSSANPHFGEEPPLVGSHGSGTLFFTGCSLKCVFCQNHDISHGMAGSPVTTRQMADMMLALERHGCHNVNFVTPTHLTPQLLMALAMARGEGLAVPAVYNCGGYESVETLRLLDGAIEIYMPDAKFWSPESAGRYCNAPDYPEVMKEALREMHRQVGVLRLDSRGVATGGLLIRHLVMPEGLGESGGIFRFISEELSPESYVNVMEQYRPCYHAERHPPLDRRLTRREYREACELARSFGLRRGFPS